jgi:dimethylamine/trimethylamine dehydrogenase
MECQSLLLVTMRDPDDSLFQELMARREQWAEAGVQRVSVLGDAQAPGTVAAAVHAGHLAARSMDMLPGDDDAVPFNRELVDLR